MERCPFCQARLAENITHCPRCDADLTLPLQCLTQSDYYCQQAMIALINRQSIEEAQQFLAQANWQKQNLFYDVLSKFLAHYQPEIT